MDASVWILIAIAVLIGSYVQAVAGFAMGMIVMAVGGASSALPLPALTAVVSLVSALNIVVALKGHVHEIDRKVFTSIACGQLPAIGLGVYLITILDRQAADLLQILLGTFIALGSLLMIVRPVASSEVSPRWVCVGAGFSGGLFGGLFAVSGPVLGWFMYRQPLALATIRATLLAAFALSTVMRTVIVGAQGDLTALVLGTSALSVPLVVAGAWLGKVAPPPASDATLKRTIFSLLVVLGSYIVAKALVMP